MKKINNKILAITLVVLVGIFVTVRLFRAPKRENNARRELVYLDRTKITEVRITSGDSAVRLVKENDKWNVMKNEASYEADSAAVERMLQTIQILKSTRMASRKKEKWAEFKVDEKGTNVSVYYDGDKEADFMVGSLGFNQNAATQSQFGGGMGQGISAYTHVRLTDEDEVYVVDGFLGASVPTGVNDWKKKLPANDSIQ